MIDPLAEVVTLLKPAAVHSKIVSGGGTWGVRRAEYGQPFYCVVLKGTCLLAVDAHAQLNLREGDFVLIPAAFDFSMSSIAPARPEHFAAVPVALGPGEFRLGDRDAPADVEMVVGHCTFGSPDAALLVSLLPQLVHVRDEPRLATLVQLVRDESRVQRAGREVVLARLLEVLLIEALRSAPHLHASPGLLRGLGDPRVATALRLMHEHPTRAWTVARLAEGAAMSRSAFFERFSRAVGLAPMEYLLAWRMAIAKDLLRRDACGITEVADRVGYSSASTFSVAFARHVGMPPGRYARDHARSGA
jgi:AraC-like DNA-binding protein